MKKRFYIKTAFLSLMSMALLSSCLKDNAHFVNFAGSVPLVELPASANVAQTSESGPFEVIGITLSSTPSALNVAVNLAAPKPLGSPLTVKLGVNADSLAKYNTANGTNYVLLPAADYSTTFTVTIPAGQNLVSLVIKINSTLLDPTQQYALPVSIINGGGQQISNYNTIIYAFTIKNAYDDTYTETGYKFHPTVGASHALTGNIPVNTVSAVTSNTAVGDLGGNGYSFNFDVSPTNTLINWAAQGAAPPQPASGFFTADNPGGVVYTTTGAAGAGIQPGTAPYVQTTYNNTYDPAKKTFWMHYGYGSGSTSQTGWTRNFYVELVAQ